MRNIRPTETCDNNARGDDHVIQLQQPVSTVQTVYAGTAGLAAADAAELADTGATAGTAHVAASGEHWTYEQTAQVAKQRGVNCDPVEFYAIINAMWSDYSGVAKRFDVDNIDYWAEMAKAFLEDKDAKPGKTALYYECIVK